MLWCRVPPILQPVGKRGKSNLVRGMAGSPAIRIAAGVDGRRKYDSAAVAAQIEARLYADAIARLAPGMGEVDMAAATARSRSPHESNSVVNSGNGTG